MDHLTFVVEMTKALAWPFSAAALALSFRRPLSKLLDGIRLRRLKVGGTEAEFGAGLDEVRGTIVAATAPGTTKSLPAPSAEKELPDFAPQGAVIWAWSQLEDQLKAAAIRVGVIPARSVSAMKVLDTLAKKTVLHPATVTSIHGLRNLRNLVAHSPEGRPVTPERAREYVTMVEAVVFSVTQDVDEYVSRQVPDQALPST